MNLLLQHPPKSKSTLTVSNHHATSPIDTTNIQSTIHQSNITSLLPVTLLSELLDPLTGYKTGLSVSSVHSVSTDSILLLMDNHSTNLNDDMSLLLQHHQRIQHPPQLGSEFQTNLKSVSDNIFIINNVRDAFRLLKFTYSDENKLPTTSEIFPYLHGLNNIRQRIFFDAKLNSDYKINQELAGTLSLDYYNLSEYSNTLNPPEMDHFPLMIISSKDPICKQSEQLLNTIPFSELFTVEDDNDEMEFIELIQYKPFSSINNPGKNTSTELNNRNFKSQIKMVATFTNFLVYNNDNDFGLNLKAAHTIAKSFDEHSNQICYILDIPDWTILLRKYLESNSIFKNPEFISNINNDDEPFSCKLLEWEQNLIWKLNSMRWIDKNVCLGTLVDFNQLNDSSKKQQYQKKFKLFINCHQNASFPELAALNQILRKLEDYCLRGDQSEELEPIYMEFPLSGSLSISTITFEETLSYLNVLKLIYFYVKNMNENVFILCYDGFTGLSLLTASLAYLLSIESDIKVTIESVILELLSNIQNDIRLYFFKNDLIFLKNLEKFISWVYFKKLGHNDNIDFQLILSLDYKEIAQFNKKGKSTIEYDWFDLNQDNNFPSRILSNLYLGSLNHASSITLLNAHKISKIISLGEKPTWFAYLNDYIIFEHEVNLNSISKHKKIIQPIHSYDFIKIYVLELNTRNSIKLSKLPHLKKIVYIYNLKDDGKDSILPLLVDIPDRVRKEILINPKTSKDTTLIHCRIGVSRSATLVIATLMKYFSWNLLDAYMYVRVKRFNIIIQPNLKIFYELFLFEEHLRKSSGESGGLRSMCWPSLCNEIHKLNNHYIASNN